MHSIIHVHQGEVRKRDPENHPAIIRRTYKGSTHHRLVEIVHEGEVVARIIHSDAPDRCGARVWVETDCEVRAR